MNAWILYPRRWGMAWYGKLGSCCSTDWRVVAWPCHTLRRLCPRARARAKAKVDSDDTAARMCAAGGWPCGCLPNAGSGRVSIDRSWLPCCMTRSG